MFEISCLKTFDVKPMSSKWDEKDSKYDDDEKDYTNYDTKSAKDEKDSLPPPQIEISSIKVDGSCRPVTDALELSITFEVDRFVDRSSAHF